MTDLFTRLARTALGDRPVAKIAAASRYAPGAELPSPETVAAEPVAIDAGTMDAPAPHRAAPLHRAAPRLSLPDPPAVAPAYAARSAMPEAPRGAEPGVATASESAPATRAAEETPAAEQPARRRVATPPPEARAPRPAVFSGAAPERPLPRPDEAAPERTTAPAEEAAQGAPPVAREVRRAPPIRTAPSTTAAADPINAGVSPAAEPQLVRPRTDALIPDDIRPREPRTETPEPPIVQVTIGRIEVRAVQPAPPPRVERPAPFAPRVSLDDYLRRHDGRKR